MVILMAEDRSLNVILDEGEDLNAYYDRNALNFFHGQGVGGTVLSGRELSCWANPLVGILPNHVADDDSVENFVELSLDTPVSAIAPYVGQVVNDLFSTFDGYQMRREAIEEWVKHLIERRL
jgi:hypothetical protein